MKYLFLTVSIILTFTITSSKALALNSLFGDDILTRNSLERSSKIKYPPVFSKVRIISILPNPEKSDIGKTKILIENNHSFKIELKGWYLQTQDNIYYFNDESIESNQIISLAEINKKNISLKNIGDTIKLYDHKSRLIHQIEYQNSLVDMNHSLDKLTGLFILPITSQKKDFIVDKANTKEIKKEIASPIKADNNKIEKLENQTLTLKKIDLSDQQQIIGTDVFPPFPTPLPTYIILFLLISSGLLLIIKKDKIVNI